MDSNKKVWIRSNSQRGEEVIKMLTDLGARNLYNFKGYGENKYIYFINHNNYISSISDSENEFAQIIKEEYKELTLPKFKKGDYLMNNDGNTWIIFKDIINGMISFFSEACISPHIHPNFLDNNWRLATKDEVNKIDNQLQCQGYSFNKETLKVEKINQFEPFDKVLVREYEEDKWRASFFSHYGKVNNLYYTTDSSWKYCIPYNEETKHLLGTTDNWQTTFNKIK